MRPVLPNMKSAQITYQIGKLIECKLLQPIEDGARTYTASFSNSYLIRGVINALRKEGIIPDL
ncbi:hypothetical protein [Xenorhabdus cabanillasii]